MLQKAYFSAKSFLCSSQQNKHNKCIHIILVTSHLKPCKCEAFKFTKWQILHPVLIT